MMGRSRKHTARKAEPLSPLRIIEKFQEHYVVCGLRSDSEFLKSACSLQAVVKFFVQSSHPVRVAFSEFGLEGYKLELKTVAVYDGKNVGAQHD